MADWLQTEEEIMTEKNTGNWLNFLSNPLIQGVKKFMYDLLGPERFAPHQDTIEALARTVFNEKDYEYFGKLMAEVYEAGYMRSVEDHRQTLEKMGLQVTLKKSEAQPANPIFNR